MSPETKSHYTKESLHNLALTIPIYQRLMHTYCTIIVGWSVLKFRTSTHPRCHWNPQRNTGWELNRETCYSFQNLKLQPYTVDTKLWWQTLKVIYQVHLGSVSQSASQSGSQSSKLCGNFDSCFRSRQGVAKLCDMYTANCPIVYLTVPKLQGLVSCSPRWTHKQLHELKDIVYWY